MPDTPVLIAGAGPVGLALAVELGLRGVECLVVEPRLRPTRLRPRAKTLNALTMEHARRWGLAARLRAAAPLRPNTGVVFRSQQFVTAAPHPPAVQTWRGWNSRTGAAAGRCSSLGTRRISTLRSAVTV
jgi:2-polyprenyl-6-methoxyphenol hydroxylase-like FAD-dependent oxidoreductase